MMEGMVEYFKAIDNSRPACSGLPISAYSRSLPAACFTFWYKDKRTDQVRQPT